MTDNKIGPHIGNIRPVTEPRPADTPSRKEQTGGADFRKVLESTVNQMQQVTDKSPAQEGQGKASAVKAEAAQAAADVAKMMQAERNLRQLHQMITHKPAQDSE